MKELKHWRTEFDSSGICWLAFDKADSSANVLSGDVLQELDLLLKRFEDNLPRGVVIHSGKPNGFIMGADIAEFTKITSEESAFTLVRLGQQVIDRLEVLKCPTVAVINGFALGGGLELALACRNRLALDNSSRILGFPEVMLGLHPGFGGTVRSVQLAGVRPALEMMLGGQSIHVGKAVKLGLVDRIVSADNWRQSAREMIAHPVTRSRPPLLERIFNLAPVRPLIGKVLRKQVAARAKPQHYPAPYAIIDLWIKYGASPVTGYEAEARSFAHLMCTDASRNLVRVFFLQNRLKTQGKKGAKKVERVHVIGAGVMGGDIASWCALKGLHVTLQDRGIEFIEPAINRAHKMFDKRIRDPQARQAAVGRLIADVNGDGVAEAEIIIEAIFENKVAKQALYRDIEPRMKESAILASNTSSIPLEDLASGLAHPERLVGLHFFNPVAKLPLVEVIRSALSADDAINNGLQFVKAIGKFPLECRSAPGFVVNRILAPYMAEAMKLAQEGLPIETIDKVAENFGMPIGPVELADSVGLDVALNVSEILGRAGQSTMPEELINMVKSGHMGRKTGQGFYRWENGKAIKSKSANNSIPADTEDRLILSMVNEAVECLHEGIVADADLLDAGVIFGTGFAPFRGGPLQYARDRGLEAVKARLRELAARYGERFTPGEQWESLK